MSGRPETGTMKFEGDWTGVFLRGDDAMHYGIALKNLLEYLASDPGTAEDSKVFAALILQGLAKTLMSCDEGSKEPRNNLLKPFDECLPNK